MVEITYDGIDMPESCIYKGQAGSQHVDYKELSMRLELPDDAVKRAIWTKQHEDERDALVAAAAARREAARDAFSKWQVGAEVVWEIAIFETPQGPPIGNYGTILSTDLTFMTARVQVHGHGIHNIGFYLLTLV